MTDEYYIIGMSPGNSYFKDEEIEYLLQYAIKKFERVAILIADIPAIATYIALGYPENRARKDKAIPKGNALKNRVKKIMSAYNFTEEQVKIIDWKTEIENNPEYMKQYTKVNTMYQTNPNFRNACNLTTQQVLEASNKELPNILESTTIAVHYLLSEIAFLEFAPMYFNVKKVIYMYHKKWYIYEDYLAGKFDAILKTHLDFFLIENPYETYNTIQSTQLVIDEYTDVLDRIEKTKILRVGFTIYEPAFMNYQEVYSGIFYEVLQIIAHKYNWQIIFNEEVGYGVISDNLNNDHFDIFGSTVWPTKQRLQTSFFSNSLYQSPVFVYIKNTAIETKESIQQDTGKCVAVKQNDISDSIADLYFQTNRKTFVPQLSHTNELLELVASGRASASFVEPYTAKLFNDFSPVKVKKAETEPIIIFDNSFMIKNHETRLKAFLDAEIEILRAEGIIEKLIRKYFITPEEFIII
jgi:cyclo(L-tyrosyl-L-tyrosyl) synthase